MKIAAIIASAAVLAVSGAALAQDAPAPFQDRTERLNLEGRRGPSLFRPGFAVGEYTGAATARSSSTRMPFRSRDFSSAGFDVATSAGEVTGQCEGGQSHVSFAWITFDRDYLDDRRFPPEQSGGVLVLSAPGERFFMALLGRLDREIFRTAAHSLLGRKLHVHVDWPGL